MHEKHARPATDSGMAMEYMTCSPRSSLLEDAPVSLPLDHQLALGYYAKETENPGMKRLTGLLQ